MNENDIYDALKKAYRRAGTQAKLAKMAGLSQGRIADYLNKRYSIGNMTCSTLLRLFPEMMVCFFHDEYPKNPIGSNVINAGDINEPVNQVSGFGIINERPQSETVQLRTLERKIRKYNGFSPEERLKFLDFIDEQL